MDWEGSDAMEDVPANTPWPGEVEKLPEPEKESVQPQEDIKKEEPELSSADKSDESEDEYKESPTKKTKDKVSLSCSIIYILISNHFM